MPPPPPPRFALVLDLDETLIWSSPIDPSPSSMPAPCPPFAQQPLYYKRTLFGPEDKPFDNPETRWVFLRPGVKHFLQCLRTLFELHVYSMGTREHSLMALDLLGLEQHLPGGSLARCVVTRDESPDGKRLFTLLNQLTSVIHTDDNDACRSTAATASTAPTASTAFSFSLDHTVILDDRPAAWLEPHDRKHVVEVQAFRGPPSCASPFASATDRLFPPLHHPPTIVYDIDDDCSEEKKPLRGGRKRKSPPSTSPPSTRSSTAYDDECRSREDDTPPCQYYLGHNTLRMVEEDACGEEEQTACASHDDLDGHDHLDRMTCVGCHTMDAELRRVLCVLAQLHRDVACSGARAPAKTTVPEWLTSQSSSSSLAQHSDSWCCSCDRCT